jgi:DNA invertase Pin-like site-specific DNA recombinase
LDAITVNVSVAGSQVAGLSLGAQEDACRAKSHATGGEIVRVFAEEGASAKTTQRPVLQQMLAAANAKRGRPDRILVYKFDRLARSSADHHATVALLLKLGVRVVSATENTDETPAGKAMEGMLAVFAEFDNNVKRERTMTGMEEAARRGRWVTTPPMGYQKSTVPGAPSLVPDPVRAPLIREAFGMMASGRHTQADVLRHITDAGLRNTHGNKIDKRVFTRTLRRPVYAGWVTLKRSDIRAKGDFEPLISEEIFDKVQLVLAGRRPHVPERQNDNEDFPLRRFVKCAHCDKPLTGHWTSGRRKKYAYYRCLTRGCPTGSIPKERLEAEYLRRLEHLKPAPEYLALFKEIVLRAWRERHVHVAEQRRVLQGRLDDLRARKDKLVEAYLDGTIEKLIYQEHAGKIDTDLAEARVSLTEATGGEIDIEAVLAFAEKVLGDPGALWRSLPAAKKVRLQSAIFPEGLAWDGRSYRTAVTSQAFAACADLAAGKAEWCPCVLRTRTPCVHSTRTPNEHSARTPWRGVEGWIRELEGVSPNPAKRGTRVRA